MKKTKITACIAAVLVLLINVCAYAKVNIPTPTENFFVNDYANVIDADTENYIFEKGKAYNSNGGPQVVVLTLTDIDNSNVEQFSIETAREWGIGSKDADNGVLILLVTESRDIRIEVGYGLEGILNDGKCGRFIRNATPLLSAGDYSGGLREIYDDIIGELEEPTPDEEDYGYIADILAPILIVLAVLFISMISRLSGGGHYRGGRFTGGGFYGGGFGGGGFSGGSFGGGGGFSGGGGGFGGGGASGKF